MLSFKKKYNWKVSSKQITFSALFAVASLIIVVILISYSPISALPTVRVALEGILVKVCGYLFGIVIGGISGLITEILINILRPTFFHWSYLVVIILYGIFGGFAYHIKNSKYNVSLSFLFSFIFVIAALFFGRHFLLLHKTINITETHKISSHLSWYIFLTSQVIIACILPLFYFLTNFVFCKYGHLFKEFSPIYLLSVITVYCLSIPIMSVGDAFSYHLKYMLLFILAIFESPFIVFGNMIIIYCVWKVLYRIIIRTQSKSYNSLIKNKNIQHRNLNDWILDFTNKNKKRKQYFIYNHICKYFKFEWLVNHYLKKYKGKIISVTGTNGKSTVALSLSEIIYKNKGSCGVFTSPHLNSINERIKINNKKITDSSLNEIIHIIKIWNKYFLFSYFEMIYLASIIFFIKNKVKFIVLECGIGAKKDCVGKTGNNSSIITNISKDHTNLLGNKVTSIANDKIHILKKNTFVLVNEKSIDILKIYNKYSNKVIGEIINCNNLFRFDETYLYYQKSRVQINKRHFLSINNLFLSTFFYDMFFKENLFINNWKYLMTRKYEGRDITFVKKDNINYLFNVAHNYHGIKFVLDYLKKEHKVVVFFSCLKTKKFKKIIDYLYSNFGKEKVFIFSNNNDNSIGSNEVTGIKLYKINSLNYVVSKVKKIKYNKIVIIGSFYFINDVKLFFKL